jgi:hypothetical protein
VHKATGRTDQDIEWHMPLSKGYAMFHAQRLLDGEAMTWPDLESTPDGRWFKGILTKLTN